MTDELRMAASLIGVRDASGGPEVLVIERTLDHRFLPGYVAFPGGAVDPTDGSLARRWFGDAEEAGRASAIRELAEEVGLAVTEGGIVAVGEEADPSLRLVSIDGAPPAVTALPEVARWIAPPQVPVRFDARYYAVRMDGAAEPAPDGVEAARAWWAPPGSLLDRSASGDVLLYWPTHYTLRALAEATDAEALLALRLVTREPDEDDLERLPRSVFYQDP